MEMTTLHCEDNMEFLYKVLNYLIRRFIGENFHSTYPNNFEPRITSHEEYLEKRRIMEEWCRGNIDVVDPSTGKMFTTSFSKPVYVSDRIFEYERKHKIFWNTYEDSSDLIINKKHDRGIIGNAEWFWYKLKRAISFKLDEMNGE